MIKELRHKSLETAGMNDLVVVGDERLQIARALHLCFDGIGPPWKVGSAPASKILHSLLPELAVMWDTPIRDKLGEGKDGYHYAYTFMPQMKIEIDEAIRSYIEEND